MGFTAQQFIDSAMKYRGVPYFEGNPQTRNGMDCSGVIQAAARDLGMTIARTTSGQLAECGTGGNHGFNVSSNLKDALPGDILHYVGHEEMWLGNGQVFSESVPGTKADVRGRTNWPIIGICRYWEGGPASPYTIQSPYGGLPSNGMGNDPSNPMNSPANTLSSLASGLSSVMDTLSSIVKFFTFLLDPANWWRVAMAAFGAILLMISLWQLTKHTSVVTISQQAVKTASSIGSS